MGGCRGVRGDELGEADTRSSCTRRGWAGLYTKPPELSALYRKGVGWAVYKPPELSALYNLLL